MKKFSATLLTILLYLYSMPVHAEVSATVDRSSISTLDLLTLTIQIKNLPVEQTPDFSALESDFELLGAPQSNTSRQMSIFNGQTTTESTVTYTLTLRPKREGRLQIPPLQIAGEQTDTIHIDVVPPSAATQQRNAGFVFFDAEVDSTSVYVQSQVIYTLKLFYRDTITGSFPTPPALPDAVVETIVEEKRYESIVNNERYHVLEKRYAIFPQKSGTLTIPAEVFRGTRVSGGIFGRRQSVSALTQGFTISVKPRPETFSGDTWIAARSFAIGERWSSQPPVFKVGEPVNRIISMYAEGLAGSLLPPLKELEIPNIKAYMDSPAIDERTEEDGLIASSVTTVGIVPTQSGSITLPEIRIPWWNLQTDKEEVAVIPGSTWEILPAEGATIMSPTVTVPVAQKNQPQVVQEQTFSVWMYITLVLGLLWLFSSWKWWHTRQALAEYVGTEAVSETPSYEFDEDQLFRKLCTACENNHASEVHRYLSQWANARFGTLSLQALQHLLKRSDLDDEVMNLESVLYTRNNHQEWRGNELLPIVKVLRDLDANQQSNTKKHDLLDSLNP